MSKQYNEYLSEHISNVKKAFYWLVNHGIVSIGDCPTISSHDASKFDIHEYAPYDEYFYGSGKNFDEFNLAWLHHIHHNPHHWQHWVLINDEDGIGPLEMPKSDAIEMICDWWSFSFKTGNLYMIFDWYEKHKNGMILHFNTRNYIENILNKIRKELNKNAEINRP